jgi:hypothetical protein
LNPSGTSKIKPKSESCITSAKKGWKLKQNSIKNIDLIFGNLVIL